MLKKLSTLTILFIGLFCFHVMGLTSHVNTAMAKDKQAALTLEEAKEKTTGRWRYKDGDTKRFYFFGAEHINLGNNTRSTVELDEQSNLIMNLSVLSTNENNENETYKLLDIKKHKMTLQNQYGEKIVLKRVNRDINTLKGTLAYRERIALPEEVAVRVNLYADGELLNTSAFFASGNIPIAFVIHFLGKKEYVQEAELTFTASIYSQFELLFETPEPLLVTENYLTVSNFKHDKDDQDKDGEIFELNIEKKGASYDVMLMQAQPETNTAESEDSAELSNEPLQNTYWRLVSINGKDVDVFANMPEPHLIIKNGKAAGSDGCNRYSLPIATIENTNNTEQDQSLSFQAGASTMMLCHEGEEQALEFMQSLASIDNYAISGKKLYLNENLDTKLIFEATAL